ncbi:uncharacterized protein SPSC_00195 [Sporisorium scitamineum]|uniref:Uncharacterized protein n=1 Tax=Sporisorium scitamineum TaxID=49012 RepID=A0A127Z795_9BASI|nr:uncharacterized protein SPSC_00195 [Sporisorium scitamineum]
MTTANLVAYHVPVKISLNDRDVIKKMLGKAFALAFPNADGPSIHVFEGRHHARAQDGTLIAFETPCSNVRASDIVAAAFLHGWQLGGRFLGEPWYVGFETTEPFYPLKFLKVPDTCKNAFIQALPAFLTKSLVPGAAIEVIDIWENQTRTSKAEDWKFNGEICVLVCMKPPLVSLTAVWPGWFHFDNEYLIKMVYPGRFDFCNFCKHTAQDIIGPNRRHREEDCIRITCEDCGHIGHNVAFDKTTFTEPNKRKCQEGKRKRSEEKEKARKQQKLMEEKAEQEAALEEAKRKAAAEEAKTKAEEADRKRAEEEELARIKAAEEEAKKKQKEAKKKKQKEAKKKKEEEAKKRATKEEADQQATQDTVGVTSETNSQIKEESNRASKQIKEPRKKGDAVHGNNQASKQDGDDGPNNAGKENDPTGDDNKRGVTAESEAVVKVEKSV